MAILILTSAGGSPGRDHPGGRARAHLAATRSCSPTATPALTRPSWPATWRGQSSSGKGLLRVAEAHRDRRPLREVVIDQCLPLDR